MLEEFLQQEYVNGYESISSEDSKIEKMMSLYPNYFYNPTKDPDIKSNTLYVTVPLGEDETPYAFYLINKKGLPEEIKKGLVGGDAGNSKYLDYVNLNDVYGVTNDLKVYYISEIIDGMAKGINFNINEIAKDNPSRVVFNSDATGTLGSILLSYDTDGNGTLTISEVKGIKTLEVDSSVNSLNDIYNLTSLEKLYLKNANLNTMNGIENCSKLSYIFIQDSIIGDYSAIGKLGR